MLRLNKGHNFLQIIAKFVQLGNTLLHLLYSSWQKDPHPGLHLCSCILSTTLNKLEKLFRESVLVGLVCFLHPICLNFRYQSIIVFNPSSKLVWALNPKCSSVQRISNFRLGWPFGLLTSQTIFPSKARSRAIMIDLPFLKDLFVWAVSFAVSCLKP